MARSVRPVSSPRGGTQDLGGGRSMRIIAGSMGAAGTGLTNDEPLGVADRFEAPPVEDRAWADEVRRREQAAGLPTVAPRQSGQLHNIDQSRGGIVTIAGSTPSRQPSDLSGLPERFTFEIERKPDGWWKVSAPASHIGLFVANQDLLQALSEAPGALAQILRLDGPTPASPKRKKKPA